MSIVANNKKRSCLIGLLDIGIKNCGNGMNNKKGGDVKRAKFEISYLII